MNGGQKGSFRIRFLGGQEAGGAGSNEARITVGSILVVIVISLIGWLYLTQASQVMITGYRLHELEAEKTELERQNAWLRFQIAELEALPRAEARARALGFGPPQEISYLPVEDYPEPEEGQRSDDLSRHYPETDDTAGADAGGEVTSDLARWWQEVVSKFATWVTTGP
jgi:hypothetical protein